MALALSLGGLSAGCDRRPKPDDVGGPPPLSTAVEAARAGPSVIPLGPSYESFRSRFDADAPKARLIVLASPT
jgi:hypothetical protein